MALAICDDTGGAPALIHQGKPWSRSEVLAFLLAKLPPETLVGIDIGVSLPFIDAGAFFPGWDESPADARGLWALIERICADDPYLSAASFVDHSIASRYFRRHGRREGDHFHLPGAAHRRGRFRVTELAQAALGCRPYSNFNLVGAAQVGKSSLTGMRMLHRLDGRIPVWPVDPLPATGPVIVEIYTALAAIAAGRNAQRSKITDRAGLDAALASLGSPGWSASTALNDHAADALITAAWLRANAHRQDLWRPAGLTETVARTEGWTFGAL
ncbi:MAG: hypothetical protein N2423_06205 [Novosphingobium sp.]|nr:hypothetical protein [Novosphingobium sp.]